MGQFFFFALLIITLLAGALAYFVPKHPIRNPVEFAMDQSGYNSMETLNRKHIQQLSMTTRNGLIQIRKQMDDMAQAQNKFLDTIQDQQQVLENTTKDASDIMLEAQEISGKGSNDNDILRLKEVTSKMQDEKRLLVANGKDLVALNNQITQSRQWISDQIDLAKINTETSLSALQQRYSMLKNQAAGFSDKAVGYNQAVGNQMDRIQDHLNELANNAAHGTEQQRSAKEHIRRMLAKEREDRIKLADSEEKSRNLLKDAQERSRDLIDEERQKAQDQQEMMRQRIEDQRQRIQDQQNR
jgi:hypothetical protein